MVTPRETAMTLRNRVGAQLARDEALAAALLAEVEGVVRGALSPETTAWLIGSLAWGGFGERSDVDLVLDGARPGEATRLGTLLVSALRREVDVLELKDLPPSFAARVTREGVALRAR